MRGTTPRERGRELKNVLASLYDEGKREGETMTTKLNWTAIISWGLILMGLACFWAWAFAHCTKGIAS